VYDEVSTEREGRQTQLGRPEGGVDSTTEKTSSNNGAYDRATGYGLVNAGKAVATCT
jgi:hypothetical protein